jgi:hypothetical protein
MIHMIQELFGQTLRARLGGQTKMLFNAIDAHLKLDALIDL